MVKRSSVCIHPSPPQIGRGPWAGVKFIGWACGRPITDHWQLTTGNYFCSATAAVLPRIMLQIKALAAKTPPVPRGTLAAHFAENNFLLKRRGGQLSQPHQKTYLNLPKYAGLEG